MLTGLRFPLNPVLMLVGILMACATFAGLALWTASWTRTAEAAQMTSMPVVLLATVGLLREVFPASARPWVDLLPGTAIGNLLRVSWFGRPPELGTAQRFDLLATWSEALPSLAVLAAWTVLAIWVAMRSMRWEPRG
jgi:ABC-2 type transport system permease protein